MFKCKVCGTELLDGTKACTQCLVCQEPPAKFTSGTLVKAKINDVIYYNYVLDSYFNQDVHMRLYRLAELMAMPVWCEGWLEPVSQDEIERVNKSGLLRPGKNGGFEYPLCGKEVTE